MVLISCTSWQVVKMIKWATIPLRSSNPFQAPFVFCEIINVAACKRETLVRFSQRSQHHFLPRCGHDNKDAEFWVNSLIYGFEKKPALLSRIAETLVTDGFPPYLLWIHSPSQSDLGIAPADCWQCVLPGWTLHVWHRHCRFSRLFFKIGKIEFKFSEHFF